MMIAITLEKAPEEVGEKGGIQMRIPLQLNTAPIRRLGRTGVTDPARRNDNGQMLEQCFTEVSRDDVPPGKWTGYHPERLARARCFTWVL